MCHGDRDLYHICAKGHGPRGTSYIYNLSTNNKNTINKLMKFLQNIFLFPIDMENKQSYDKYIKTNCTQSNFVQ